MDDLYATSPSNSDVSVFSHSSCNTEDLYVTNNSKKYGKKKKKNRNKEKFNQYIREESNIFEIFNHDNFFDYSNKQKNTNSYNNCNELIPRNEVQKQFVDFLNNDNIPIIFSIGPAGTGKTFLGCHYAIKSFLEGKYDKIIITRPTVSVDEDIGYLPGTMNEKMLPWLKPIYDVFDKYINNTYTQKLIKEGCIEICPLAYMRGRTFEDCVILADEMQNSTHNQMKMILTRISLGSKLIINGDLEQSDSSRNGLKDFISKYEKYNKPKDDIRIIKFKNNDVQRHSVIKTILDIYE